MNSNKNFQENLREIENYLQKLLLAITTKIKDEILP